MKSQDTLRFNDLSILSNKLLSHKIINFVLKEPFSRLTILSFILFAKTKIKINEKIIDIGAGESPYKSIFKNSHYYSSDFAFSIYQGKNNFTCPAHKIPTKNNFFNSIICTEVLEHIPNPRTTFSEFNRILKPNGKLFITVPFIIQPHEVPYDYFRYTPYILKKILKKRGFNVIFICPRCGVFTTIINIFLSWLYSKISNKNSEPTIKYSPPLTLCLKALVAISSKLDIWLDHEQFYPLGYSIYARKTLKKI